MRPVITCFIIIFSSFCTASDLSNKEIKLIEETFEKTPVNTFRYLGNQISCKTDDPNDEYACHRIGQFKVGDDFSLKTKPYKIIQQDNGVIGSVYVIVANDEYEAYWVIGHKDKVIVSIQITGNYPNDKLSFSTIKLTDSKSHVKKLLGPRFKVTTVDEINGEIWDYFPFPISIEFKNDLVYSVLISE